MRLRFGYEGIVSESAPNCNAHWGMGGLKFLGLGKIGVQDTMEGTITDLECQRISPVRCF